MKIGEIVAASVIEGLVAKLQLGNPEELKIAFPVIVEGRDTTSTVSSRTC